MSLVSTERVKFLDDSAYVLKEEYLNLKNSATKNYLAKENYSGSQN
jgi:hypothetical protein